MSSTWNGPFSQSADGGHRLMISGSDRVAEVWRRGYAIEGSSGLELHHLYRAMARLGEELPADQQFAATPFLPPVVRKI